MTDYRYCPVCGAEYNALRSENKLGHNCRLIDLQRASLLAYDGGDMDAYADLEKKIQAKMLGKIGSIKSDRKAKSSAKNGEKGGRPKGKDAG